MANTTHWDPNRSANAVSNDGRYVLVSHEAGDVISVDLDHPTMVACLTDFPDECYPDWAAQALVNRGVPEGPLDDGLIEQIAQLAFKRTRPLTNINGDVVWRREMVPVLVRRAFAAARGSGAPSCTSL